MLQKPNGPLEMFQLCNVLLIFNLDDFWLKRFGAIAALSPRTVVKNSVGTFTFIYLKMPPGHKTSFLYLVYLYVIFP